MFQKIIMSLIVIMWMIGCAAQSKLVEKKECREQYYPLKGEDNFSSWNFSDLCGVEKIKNLGRDECYCEGGMTEDLERSFGRGLKENWAKKVLLLNNHLWGIGELNIKSVCGCMRGYLKGEGPVEMWPLQDFVIEARKNKKPIPEKYYDKKCEIHALVNVCYQPVGTD